MQIISHRGAKGHGSENTVESITLAATKKVAYIEFDTQYTKNNHVVVYHDAKTPSGKRITELTYKALQREVPNVTELDSALAACGKRPALIETKVKGTIARSLRMIKKYPSAAIASFLPDEILVARINLPSHTTFLLQHYHPFGIVQKALAVDAQGIGLNKNWFVLFPYYYRQAKKHKLQIYTYTVNSSWLAEWLHTFFPMMYICTDYPYKLLALSKGLHK